MDKERITELKILELPLAMAKNDLKRHLFEPDDKCPIRYSYLSNLYDAYDELLELAGLKKKDMTEPSNMKLDMERKQNE